MTHQPLTRDDIETKYGNGVRPRRNPYAAVLLTIWVVGGALGVIFTVAATFTYDLASASAGSTLIWVAVAGGLVHLGVKAARWTPGNAEKGPQPTL